MLDSARRLRLQARSFENRGKPTGTRYSPAFRAEVVRHARAQVREGVAVSRIARSLGLRPKTLTLWMRDMPASKLRTVRVVPGERDARALPSAAAVPAAEQRLVVVTPSGVRVEGLDVDGVVQVLRVLA